MTTTLLSRRAFAALALLTAVACGDDPVGSDGPEPAVSAVRLTLSGQASPVTISGAAGGNRAFTIPVGATTVTAQWLRPDGSVDPVVTQNAADYELRVLVPAGSGLTFARSGASAFTGTLTATAAATGTPRTVQLQLFHVGEGHEDFALDATVTVTGS